MDQPKKNLYKKLNDSGKYTKSFEEFESQFSSPEQQEKLYSSLSSKGLYTKSKEEFSTQFFSESEKKKPIPTSTSQSQKSASSGPEETSLDGKKTSNQPSKHKEGSMDWNLEKLKQTKDYKEINKKYKEATTLSDEEKSESVKSIQDEVEEKGIWNTVKSTAKAGWNKVIDVAATTSPSNIGLLGLKTNTDVLASEKKEAVELLTKQGYKPSQITNEVVKKTAVNLKIDKLNKSKIDSKRRDFLSNHDDDENEFGQSTKDKLKGTEQVNVAAKSQKKSILENEIKIKDGVLSSAVNELKEVNNELKSYKDKGQAMPEELISKHKEVLLNYQNAAQESITVREDFQKNDSELNTAQENLDYLKRDYHKLKNISGNVMATLSDLTAGTIGAVNYGLEAKQSLLGDNGWDDTTQNFLKKASDTFTDIGNEERNSIMKPVSVEDINSVNDVGRYLGQTLANQAPIMASIALGGGYGVAFLGVESTGAKYNAMQEEMNPRNPEPGQMVPEYSKSELLWKPLGYGVTETASAVVDRILLGNVAKIVKSATEPERKMMAQGMANYFIDASKTVSKNSLMEGTDEGLTQGFQNLIDGKPFMENMTDPIAAGAIMGGILPLGGHTVNLVSKATKPFSTDGKIQKISAEILALQSELDKASTPETKQTISDQIKIKEEGVKGLLIKRISDIESLSKEQFQEVIRLEKAQQNIKNQAKSIKADTNISDEMSNQILKNLESEFNANETRRKELITGNASTVLEKMVDGDVKEMIRLKDVAQRELMSEMNPDGTKDVALDDTKISKKAIQILNKEKTAATREEPAAEMSNNEQSGESGTAPVTQENEVSTEPINANTEPTSVLSENEIIEQAQTSIPSASVEDAPTAIVSEKQNETTPTNNTDVDGSIRPRTEGVEQNGVSGEQNSSTENISEPIERGPGESDSNTNKRTLRVSDNGSKYNASLENGVLSFKDKHGKSPSAPTKRKLQEEWSKTIDFTQGETARDTGNVYPETYEEDVAQHSNNPAEIAEAIVYAQTADYNEGKVDPVQIAIANALGGKAVKRSSFVRFGDRNKLNKSIAGQYITSTSKGGDIDTIAQEVEIEVYGDYDASNPRVTTEDVVNFMYDNPRGAKSFLESNRNSKLEALKNAFTQVTGLPANDKFIEKAVAQNAEKLTRIENEEILYTKSYEDLLSLDKEYEQYKENQDGKRSNTGNETSVDTKNETESRERSGIQEISGREISGNEVGREQRKQQLKGENEQKGVNSDVLEALKEKNLQWVKDNIQRLVEAYKKSNGNTIDPDAARDLFSEIGYDKSNLHNFQKAEWFFTDYLYEDALDSTDNKTVLFITGVGGSGKSFATEKIDKKSKGVVFDSSLNRFEDLARLIEIATKKGFSVEVVQVYNDPLTAFSNNIKRGIEIAKKEGGTGRFLGIGYFLNSFEANIGKLKTLKYTIPNIEISGINNSENNPIEVDENNALNFDYEIKNTTLEKILELILNESDGLTKNQIALIGEGLQGVKDSYEEWNSNHERLAERIRNGIHSTTTSEVKTDLGQNEGGRKSGNVRLDETSDSTSNNSIPEVNQSLNNLNEDIVLDWLKGLKLDPNNTNTTLPFLPQTWNAFIEAVTIAVKSGYKINNAIQIAIDELKSKGFDFNDVQKVANAFAKKAGVELQNEIEGFKRKAGKRSLIERLKLGKNQGVIAEFIKKINSDYDVQNQNEVEQKAKEFIEGVGVLAAIDAVKNRLISTEGGLEIATLFYAKEKLAKLIKEELSKNISEQEIKDLQDLFIDTENLFAKIATQSGQQISYINHILNGQEEIEYSFEKVVTRYKEANGGDISSEKEAEFKQMHEELKVLREKIKDQEEVESKQNANEILNDILESESKVKNATSAKTRREKARLTKEALTNFQNRLKSRTYDATAGVPVAIINQGVEVIKLAIDAEVEIAEAIERGIAKIKELYGKNWDKEGDFRRDALEDFADLINYKENSREVTVRENGSIEIPRGFLSGMINSGVSDLEGIVAKIKEDLQDIHPEITERQIRDSITGYGRIVSKTKSDLHGDIAKLKREGKLQSELEDVRKGISKTRIPSRKKSLTEKEKALKAQIKQLQDDLGITESERTKRSEKYNQKRIEELKERIRNKDYSKKEIKPIEKSEELRKLIIQKNRIQERFDAEVYVSELKSRTKTKKAIDFLLDQVPSALKNLMTTGEFSFIMIQGGKFIKQDILSPSTYVNLAKEFKGTTAQQWKNSPFKTFKKVMRSVNSIDAITNMLSGMADSDFFNEFQDNLKVIDQYDEFVAVGLRVLGEDVKTQTKDEMYHGSLLYAFLNLPFDLATKLDGNKKRTTIKGLFEKIRTGEVSQKNKKTIKDQANNANPFNVFERANTVFMNTIRVKLYMKGRAKLVSQGKNYIDNKEDFKNLASVVNSTTGSANLHEYLKTAVPALNMFMFSARLAASGINHTVGAIPYFIKLGEGSGFSIADPKSIINYRPTVAQKMFLGTIVKSIAFSAALGGIILAKLNAGRDDEEEKAYIETDPRSADFGKIVDGSVRHEFVENYDRKWIPLLAQIATSQRKDKKGNIVPTGSGYGSKTDWDIITKFGTNYLAPAPGMAAKYWQGHEEMVLNEDTGIEEKKRVIEFGGEMEDVSITEQFKANARPMIFKTLKEITEDDKEMEKEMFIINAFFGYNTTDYNKKELKSGAERQ